jgi:hypothetical protein
LAPKPGIYYAHEILSARNFQERPEYFELTNWWQRGRHGIVTISGIGGSGKTAIVSSFLKNFPEIDNANTPVFVYSFYESSDANIFFNLLRSWIRQSSIHDYALSIDYLQVLLDVRINLEKHHVACPLLVLDGLEAIQSLSGQVENQYLEKFLLGVSSGSIPLRIVVTTRLPLFLPEISPLHHHIPLYFMDESSLCNILKSRNIQGSKLILSKLVRKCGYHPLTIEMVSGYIFEFLNGNPSLMIDDLPFFDAISISECKLSESKAYLVQQQARLLRITQMYRKLLSQKDPLCLKVLEQICLATSTPDNIKYRLTEIYNSLFNELKTLIGKHNSLLMAPKDDQEIIGTLNDKFGIPYSLFENSIMQIENEFSLTLDRKIADLKSTSLDDMSPNIEQIESIRKLEMLRKSQQYNRLCEALLEKSNYALHRSCLDPSSIASKIDRLIRIGIIQEGRDGKLFSHIALRDPFIYSIAPDLEKLSHQVALKSIVIALPKDVKKFFDDIVTESLCSSESIKLNKQILAQIEEYLYHSIKSGRTYEAWRIYLSILGGVKQLSRDFSCLKIGYNFCKQILLESKEISQDPDFILEYSNYLMMFGRPSSATAYLYSLSGMIKESQLNEKFIISALYTIESLIYEGNLPEAMEVLCKAQKMTLGRYLSYYTEDNRSLCLIYLKDKLESYLHYLNFLMGEDYSIEAFIEGSVMWAHRELYLGNYKELIRRLEIFLSDSNHDLFTSANHPIELFYLLNAEGQAGLNQFTNAEKSIAKFDLSFEDVKPAFFELRRRYSYYKIISNKISRGNIDDYSEIKSHINKLIETIEDSLTLGYGLLTVDFLNLLAVMESYIGEFDSSIVHSLFAIFGSDIPDTITAYQMPGCQNTILNYLSMDHLYSQATSFGTPPFKGAGWQKYCWGESTARYNIGIFIIKRIAQVSGNQSIDIAEKQDFKDPQLNEIYQFATEEVESALAIAKKIDHPDISHFDFRNGIIENSRIIIPQEKKESIATTSELKSKRIFIGYSREDEEFLSLLYTSLRALKLSQSIDFFSDQELRKGDFWEEKIFEHLSTANYAILLISQYFLSSDFIVNKEVPYLLKSSRDNKTKIFLVAIRHFAENLCPELMKLQFVNPPEKPLSTLSKIEQEKTFVSLINDLAK